MTVKDFIDKRVRPLIGDSLKSDIPSQMVKYDENVLLDYLNEGVLDIAENSKLFLKQGATLLRAGDTKFKVPNDFKGWYDTKSISVGTTTNYRSDFTDIKVMPDIEGVRLDSDITSSMVQQYSRQLQGVVLPTNLIDLLVESNQIELPPVNQLAVDILGDAILVPYRYLYLPDEFTLETELEDRFLMYLLKWWVSAHALYGDMHNEASNLASIYEKKYLRRLDKAGQKQHTWNKVVLTTWT